MESIIPKGTLIPTSRTKRFQTVLYRQDKISISIFEGEFKNVKNNTLLSVFSIENLPESESEIEFDVTFSLDQNGVLTATAHIVNNDSIASSQFKINDKILLRKNSNINNINDDVDLNLIKNKTFFKNIQLFLDYNRSSLLNFLNMKEINDLLAKAELDENCSDINELPDLVVIADYYKNKKLNRYFKNHQVPGFLNISE